ncbi:MAG: glucan 1,4-alpha-glucosidase [Blastocatellia bacterium]|nr:MAG: glucan 1,4-alpha-glucosidase [Blastocatellia bacterium]
MKNYRAFTAALLLFFFCFQSVIFSQTPPYKDTSLPFEKRADDLVSRMTLEEKVSQMMNGAAAIERLGIPEYDWWNEALHGVARAGYATVFPQAIGLAATWNTDLMFQVADVISTEARAKNNEFLRQNDHGRYKGLTFWSPNINIFRDPRWGRGQETYGEDPYLTARLGVAFVKGLQGNDPRYFKVIATPKHYAVHSGPEPERHSFDAKAIERDLQQTYLPAFRATIVEGNAQSVMCAYNRTNSEPACTNKELFDYLRNKWRFGGYVVSDCGAIDDIYMRHHFLKTVGEASAAAVKTGTDLTCGREYRSLVQAVKDGLISEKEIDVAVKRLMLARFQLGMFDPPSMVPYARIPFSENDSEAHRQLALRAARESIVLLKNDKSTLPLKKDLNSIAVIGPSADALNVLLGNYNGTPSKYVTPLEGIRRKVSPTTKVLYAQGMYPTGVFTEPVTAKAFAGGSLRGEYFSNRELKGDPTVTRNDAQINFDWGPLSPANGIPADNFSVRWSGKLLAPESGKYLIGFAGNGGARLLIDGQVVAEELTNRRTRTFTKEITLEGGRSYDLRFEYFENANPYAAAKLIWAPPTAANTLQAEALDKARQADAVIMVMGISPSIEGEEMDVQVEGFRGGDRTDIALPKPQEDLIKEVQALGKPVVLVLLGGSALSVNWANDNVPAILDAWYPGEEGGTAVADVLFGDYNPAGRLPVTFYKSINDLPPFTEYSMQGRTYRYFKGDPLYPFGFGLSYTNFRYSNLQVSPARLSVGDPIDVSVEVQNTGSVTGDEVVQAYLTDIASSFPVPIRSLVGMKRVTLKPGQNQKISFKLNPEQMTVVDDNGKRWVEPGEFVLSVGGKQPGFTGSADVKTTTVLTRRFTLTGQKKELPLTR